MYDIELIEEDAFYEALKLAGREYNGEEIADFPTEVPTKVSKLSKGRARVSRCASSIRNLLSAPKGDTRNQ